MSKNITIHARPQPPVNVDEWLARTGIHLDVEPRQGGWRVSMKNVPHELRISTAFWMEGTRAPTVEDVLGRLAYHLNNHPSIQEEFVP